jgi:hypothetical protein
MRGLPKTLINQFILERHVYESALLFFFFNLNMSQNKAMMLLRAKLKPL